MKNERQKVIFQPSVTSMLRTRTPALAQHSVAPIIRTMPLRCSAGVRIRKYHKAIFTTEAQRAQEKSGRQTKNRDVECHCGCTAVSKTIDP